jgi:hypothetical protein
MEEDKIYNINGMYVNIDGIRVLPPKPDDSSGSTEKVVTNYISTTGYEPGKHFNQENSGGTADNPENAKVVVGGSGSAQSVKEVHALSGEEWYYQRAQELQNEHPDWTPDQITNKMSEIIWDNNYQALIDEIANSSSPGERERLISEHQAELDKYKASGIKVDNDITYLRNVQGMPSIIMDLGEYGQSEQYQKDQAIVNEWQRRVDSGQRLNNGFDQTYQYEVNAAAIRVNLYNGFQAVQKYGFFDDLISKLYADHMRWGYAATLTKQDQDNGYKLDYFPDVDAKLRVRSDNDIHPDDLIMYHEHLKNATNSWEKELTKGTMAGTLGLGEPDGSGWTQFGYNLTKNAPQIDLAVSMAFGGYGPGKILLGSGQRAALSAENLGDKIGSEWTSKVSPSEIAKSSQGTQRYPGVDRYRDITVKRGNIVYRGEPKGTEYFTTKSAVKRADGDATKLFEGLQVEKHAIFGYRSSVQGYFVNEDASGAFSITKANPDYGKGGLPQIFIPDANELIEKGILVPVYKIDLINYK